MTALELLPRETGASPGERIGPYLLHEKKGKGDGRGLPRQPGRGGLREERCDQAAQPAAGAARRSSAVSRANGRSSPSSSIPTSPRLLGGGTSEAGLPYFVMELVDGMPIDEYCEQQGLAIDERLALFLEVCSAPCSSPTRT